MTRKSNAVVNNFFVKGPDPHVCHFIVSCVAYVKKIIMGINPNNTYTNGMAWLMNMTLTNAKVTT